MSYHLMAMTRWADNAALTLWIAGHMPAAVVKAKTNNKKQGDTEEALDYIGRLYAIEKEARKDQFDAKGISPVEGKADIG